MKDLEREFVLVKNLQIKNIKDLQTQNRKIRFYHVDVIMMLIKLF